MYIVWALYIYIYKEREGESKREKDRERKKTIKEAKEKMEALYIYRYI